MLWDTKGQYLSKPFYSKCAQNQKPTFGNTTSEMPSNQFQSYRRVLKGEALWTNIYEFGRKLSSIFFRLCHRQDEIGNPWTFCHPEWRHKILTFSLGRSSLPPLRESKKNKDKNRWRRLEKSVNQNSQDEYLLRWENMVCYCGRLHPLALIIGPFFRLRRKVKSLLGK